jgi:hypothetical protein
MSDLILEHLKRIQADVAETRRDVRDLKASSAMILGMIGDGEGLCAGGRTFCST